MDTASTTDSKKMHALWSQTVFFFLLLVYRILGSKTTNTVYSSFLSLTVEKPISYYYLLSLLVPIISYYSFFEKSTPYETVTNAMKSAQNLSPGRFRHAEAESEIKNKQVCVQNGKHRKNEIRKEKSTNSQFFHICS